jgi:hypothetical protein
VQQRGRLCDTAVRAPPHRDDGNTELRVGGLSGGAAVDISAVEGGWEGGGGLGHGWAVAKGWVVPMERLRVVVVQIRVRDGGDMWWVASAQPDRRRATQGVLQTTSSLKKKRLHCVTHLCHQLLNKPESLHLVTTAAYTIALPVTYISFADFATPLRLDLAGRPTAATR